MNFTLDDSSTLLSYSDNWGIQPAADPAFFEGTYHVAERDGASISIQFTGTAIALYGSTGPGHGNYRVQYDNFVVLLSANASETQYQQPLFQTTWTDNTQHLVNFTAHPTADGPWVDFDFLTIDSANASSSTPTTTSGGSVATLAPPWSTSPTSSQTPTPTAASDASTARTSHTALILAALFGGILGLLLIGGATYLALRRLHGARRARERQFRYGAPSVTPKSSGRLSEGVARTSLAPGGGTGAGGPAYVHMLLPMSSPTVEGSFASEQSEKERPSEKESAHDRGASPASGSGSGGGASGHGTTYSRGFLAGPPFKKVHKGDADSLRTDFLQV